MRAIAVAILVDLVVDVVVVIVLRSWADAIHGDGG
jgi:hypothetical protein